MSGVGTNPQGGQLSDLEQLQLKSNAVTDESLGRIIPPSLIKSHWTLSNFAIFKSDLYIKNI